MVAEMKEERLHVDLIPYNNPNMKANYIRKNGCTGHEML